jgi:hypothetical protein
VEAARAGEQRDTAVRMAARVDEFRLPGASSAAASQVDGLDIDAIIDAHRQWKVKLRDAIEQRSTVGGLINARHYPKAEAALAAGTPFANCTNEVVLCLSAAKRLGF